MTEPRTQAPIRVLYCENNVDGTVGGSYFSLLYLVKGLNRTRFEPIVVFRAQHALLPAFREAGIETIVWPPVGQAFTFASGHGRIARSLRPVLRPLQQALNFSYRFLGPALHRAWFLTKRRVDIVHLNNSVLCNHDWMFAATLARKKCLTHERGINEVYTPAARYFGKRLDAVICISDAVRQNFADRGAAFPNMLTIYNGLDPSVMRVQTPAGELRKKYGLDRDAIVIGMVGNIKQWKGQDTLIRAVDKVRRTFPAVRCVLVGDTSPDDRAYENEIHQLVADLGVEQHIIFTGYQRNVTDFLTMSDIVVHASTAPEPFGRVILEAMACRKPVIGARAGAIPEIVEEERTGLTFPPGDADQLAAALTRLIRNRPEAERLGENGYDRLIQHFHISQNIESTQRVYDELVSAAR